MKTRKYLSPEPGEAAGAVSAPPAPVAPVAEKKEAAEPAPEPVAPVVEAIAAKPVVAVDLVELDAKEKLAARLSTLDARLEKAREKEVLTALRRMGADPEIVSDADLLALAPKVDPLLDEAAATAELLKFKEKRKGWFKALQVGPQEDLNRYGEQLKGNAKLTDEDRAKRARLAARLGGNR